jgi:hypothetical protein
LAKYNGISIKKGRGNLKKPSTKLSMVGDILYTPLTSQDLDEEFEEETPEEETPEEEEDEEWEEEVE